MLYSSYASILWGTWGRATIPQMERFVADARRDGVDYAAWGHIERVLFGINHGNAFRNPRAELAHNIDACAKRDEFNCWFPRYELELELNLLDDAERSIAAALRLRPDHIEALEQRALLYEQRGMLPQARETLEHAASRESGWAYSKLIYAHNTGNALGIQKDEVKARLLAEEAAGMHIAAGADALSWFYQAGTGGLTQNVERAIAWELMAAHGGMARAANNRPAVDRLSPKR